MWAGQVTARHVNRLIEHLRLEPTSRVSAIDSGDLDWMGWDTSAHIQASMHNWIVRLIAGLSKGMSAEDFIIRTPDSEDEPQVLQFETIADFIAAGADRLLTS